MTYQILGDTNHKVTKFLLYLHTMQSFIFQDLKIASRNEDKSKIMSLGPYALCLSYILEGARSNDKGKIDYVYRGMVMTNELFNL